MESKMKTWSIKLSQPKLHKNVLVLLLFLASSTSFGQDYNESSMSLAVSTGIGFTEIKKVNGGAYGENTAGNTAGIGHDFKYKPLYWSLAWTIKKRQHEFGLEFEKLKYHSLTYASAGVNVTYTVNSTLVFTYFNSYYKFLFPIEVKDFTPYLKAGMNFNVYTYDYESAYINTYGGTGVNTGGNVGLGFMFNLQAGINYYINKNISAFAEAGYGPVVSKVGLRLSFLKNVMST